MKVSVLVTHPGRQHSHRAALALEKGGRLAGYWSGVPSVESDRGLLPQRLWRRFVRYAPVPLPPGKLASAPWVPGIRRLGDRLPAAAATRIDFAACRMFDRWASRKLRGVEAAAVLACEISARDTLRAAKDRGWLALLDAPAIHPAAQDRWHGHREPPALHRRIIAVKYAEIELSDAIVTVSEFARETYLEAGVAKEKVLAVALGAELAIFGANPRTARSGACRFLFAGAPIARKGFDLLVGACEQMIAAGIPFELRLAGPKGEQSSLVERLPRDRWSQAGSLTQAGLAVELASADVLVLPSRNDSYGMVVAEALASGVPAVVSTHVGARELIDEGRTGWIVEAGDREALASRLATCAQSTRSLRELASACRERARHASWEAYEQRFLATLVPLLERPRA